MKGSVSKLMPKRISSPKVLMGDWQAIWDKEAKANYYWNPKTNETTWDNPEEEESIKPQSEATQEQKLEEYYKSKEYYDWYMQQMNIQAQQQASQTFQDFKQEKYKDLISNISYDSTSHASYQKDIKHMSAYFDVEKYQRERAQDRAKPQQQKLTKKQVDQYKKRNKEMKMKKLIERMGTD
jgi:hypothetical protein